MTEALKSRSVYRFMLAMANDVGWLCKTIFFLIAALPTVDMEMEPVTEE